MTTLQGIPAEQARQLTRSTFVSVLAWVLIVCSGFETFISLMQAVMLTFFFPDQFWSNTQSPHGIEKLPPLMQFLFSKAQYFFATFWLLSVVTLVSSIALLRRKNWARLFVVGIFALAIIWTLGGIWLQSQVLSELPRPPHAPPDFDQHWASMSAVFQVGGTIFAIALAALFAWLIRRLVSKPIREEFRAP